MIRMLVGSTNSWLGEKRSRVKMLDLGCGKRGVQRWEQGGRSARKLRGKWDPFSGWRACSWPCPSSPGDCPARLRNLGPCPCRKLLCPCRGWACHRPRTREFCRLRHQIGRKGEFAGRSSSNVEEGSWFEFVVGVSWTSTTSVTFQKFHLKPRDSALKFLFKGTDHLVLKGWNWLFYDK